MDERRNNMLLREVEKLASGLLDNQLSQGEVERLEAQLRDLPEARSLFVDCMFLHSLLQAQHERELDSTGNAHFEGVARLLTGGALEPDSFRCPQPHHDGAGVWAHRRIAFTASLATSVVMIVGLVLWLFGGREQQGASEDRYVGVLSQAVAAEWDSVDPPPSVPARLEAGQRLALKSGYVQLTLNSGCTCSLKGPAVLELVSPMRVRALSGAIWTRVGEEAKGFAIETPTALVVDQGTEFGVNVADSGNATDVVVFEGVVDLKLPTERAGRGNAGNAFRDQRLTSGEALRIEKSGAAYRIIAVNSEQYPRSLQMPDVQYRRPLIGGVSDNIRDPHATMYYQIVRAGLFDDCRAYVDRKHEWNGVDKEGIPAMLRGADYVMCFNNDKWTTDLQIVVDVSAPARLFIFFDDRLPIPKWLAERFQQTEYKIGVDEGYPRGNPAPQRTAFGAGKSIDTVYSVWQADFDRPGPVKLGALPKSAVEVSMYGIAAVPLEKSP